MAARNVRFAGQTRDEDSLIWACADGETSLVELFCRTLEPAELRQLLGQKARGNYFDTLNCPAEVSAEIALIACKQMAGAAGHGAAEDRTVLFLHLNLQLAIGKGDHFALPDQRKEIGQSRRRLQFQISSRLFDGIRIGQAGAVF